MKYLGIYFIFSTFAKDIEVSYLEILYVQRSYYTPVRLVDDGVLERSQVNLRGLFRSMSHSRTDD